MTEEAKEDELRHRLALRLEGADAIQSAEWFRVFNAVPRHRFVPRVSRALDHWGEERMELDGADPEQREAWLKTVYSDVALAIPCQEGGRSSSTEEIAQALDGQGETRRCRRPPRIVEAGGDQRSFWAMMGTLAFPYDAVVPAGRGVMAWYDVRDSSWLRLDYRRQEVTQGGPRRIWDEVESLFEQWCRLGAPNRDRFGLTVTHDGRHILWLDSPTSENAWQLPTQPQSARMAEERP